jgi:hypothetical protein
MTKKTKSTKRILERKVRFNLSSIDPNKIKTNALGGIVVDGVVIRTGVFEYETENGDVVREWLPREELFRDNVLKTLEGVPVTNEHPDTMISPENFKSHSVGHVSNVRVEDERFIVATLNIVDQETLNQIFKESKRELSAGYFVDPVRENGVSPEGEEYDYIQKNLVFNHCSIVHMGRCGPEVSLRLNSSGDLVRTNIEKNGLLNEKSGNNMRKSKKNTEVVEKETENVEEELSPKTFLNSLAAELELAEEEVLVKLEEKMPSIVLLLQDEATENSEDEEMEEKDNSSDEDEKKEVQNSKNNDDEDKFSKRVNEEVEARIGLLVAAKELGVQEISPTIPRNELVLKIVETTKPHMDLKGRSPDFIQALLEDSLSNVDLSSFWTKKEKEEKEIIESNSEDALELKDTVEEESTLLNDDFDGMPGDEVSEATLNSILKVVRSSDRNNGINGNTKETDIYSAEEKARRLVYLEGRKLL